MFLILCNFGIVFETEVLKRNKSQLSYLYTMRNLTLTLLLAVFTLGSVTAQEINWVTFEEALELQKKKPKKIMIDMYTEWCGPCRTAKEHIGKVAYLLGIQIGVEDMGKRENFNQNKGRLEDQMGESEF